MIEIATTYVNPNEKAMWYQELHEASPDASGARRYRKIYVKRDGNLAIYTEDMGLASEWKGTRELNIPLFFEHSVAEALDLAQNLRNETKIDLHDWLEIDDFKEG